MFAKICLMLVIAQVVMMADVEKSIKDMSDDDLKREITSLLRTSQKDKEGGDHFENKGKEPEHTIINNCVDLYDSKQCYVLIKKWKMKCGSEDDTKEDNKLGVMCRKACGFCGAVPLNPNSKCVDSKYGCCWDALTTKIDKVGSNCPACKDNDKDLCQGNENECNVVGWIGDWMRENCKATCDSCITKPYPKPVCKDKLDYKFCANWKEHGVCEAIPNLMAKHCLYTCFNCRIRSLNEQ